MLRGETEETAANFARRNEFGALPMLQRHLAIGRVDFLESRKNWNCFISESAEEIIL